MKLVRRVLPDAGLVVAARTALTRYEQEGARKRLVTLGVLQEELRGVPAKMWYRVEKDVLYRLLLEHIEHGRASSADGKTPTTKLGEFPPTEETPIQLGEKPPTSRRKTHQPAGGNPPDLPVENPPAIPTENTSETTQETTQRGAGARRVTVPNRRSGVKKEVVTPARLREMAEAEASASYPKGIPVNKTGKVWEHLVEAHTKQLLKRVHVKEGQEGQDA